MKWVPGSVIQHSPKGKTNVRQSRAADFAGQIGMTAEEVHRKPGAPTHIPGNQDLYMISDSETAQIANDNSHQVITISTDYMGGVGAPDYKAVVGPDIETQADGSLYKIVWYKSAGFWISYNRTNGTLPFVTVTIQKIK